MRRLIAFLFFCLPACNGIPDIPWPPNPPPAGEAYNCANPPALSGLVQSASWVGEDRYVVVLKTAPLSRALTVAKAVETFASGVGATNVVPFSSALTGFSATISAPSILAKILADANVAYVQQVGTKEAVLAWGLDRSDQRALPLDGTYVPFSTGSGANVAIVDTGIDMDHPDFANRVSPECFTAHTLGGCEDMHDHGTHVAGIVAGTTWGIAPTATLYAVRVLDARGSGTDTDVIGGIDWVVQKKKANPGQAWVINMSLGGSPAPALDQATCNAIAAGVTVVVAAGNESNPATSSSPARVLQAITIGASDKSDRGASFTNYGPVVDLFAPGVDVESAKRGGGSVTFSGTSMASPHVAGAAALWLGENSSLAPADVAASIVGAATPDVLSSIGEGSPNRLLFVGKAQGGPAECLPDVSWCHETGQACSVPDRPCKHNPTDDPAHCELAPECEEEPSPPQMGCIDEEKLVPSPGCQQKMALVVRDAMQTLGDLRGHPPQENLKKLAAEITEQTGRCAIGGHEAVFILRDDGLAEENHAVFFGDGGWITPSGKFVGCHTGAEPRSCSLTTFPSFVKWNAGCPKAHGRWWDCAALFGDSNYCEATGQPGRTQCPVLPEGHPERASCELAALGGPPLWKCERGGVAHPSNGNPWLAACADGGAGWIEICLPDGTNCKRRSFQ